MMTVNIIFQGSLSKGLQSFQDRMDGKKGNLYPHLGKLVNKSIKANFQAGGRAPTWPNREQTYSWPILDRTGKMKRAAEHSALADWIFAGPIRYLRIYGPKYAPYQQYGVKKMNLPSRRFVKLTPKDRLFMLNRIRHEWRAAWQGLV